MSTYLYFTCQMEAGRGTAYWWPLVCEILREHDFHFSNPDLPEKTNTFYCFRYLPPYEGEKEEDESRIGSFRDLWDELYRQVGGVNVPFFWKDNDFSMDVSLGVFPGLEQGPLQVRVDFALAAGQIGSLTSEEAKAMIKLVLFCFRDLYELCRPMSAKIYWNENGFEYAPWAVFEETPPERNTDRGPDILAVGVHLPSEYRLMKEPLSNGKFLFLFDPIPIPSSRVLNENALTRRWEFLSLEWP